MLQWWGSGSIERICLLAYSLAHEKEIYVYELNASISQSVFIVHSGGAAVKKAMMIFHV